MAIVTASNRANLSAEFLEQNWNVPQLLRNDYISSNLDIENLFNNDIEIDARLTQAEADIVSLDARVTINEAAISAIDVRLTSAEASIVANAANIATNTTNIATNTTNIATNSSAIADINDGRYSPQFGSGSPEGVVTANRNQTYFDTSVPSMWVNSTIGASTGWVQVV